MVNLTEKLENIWRKIKNQPLDVWFFYLFLLIFILSVRKVMLFFPLKGTFNEYAGIYVYASDIFLCLAILLWFMPILYNKILNLSMSSEGASELIHKKNCVETVDNSPSHKLSTDKFAYFKAFIAKIGKMFHLPTGQAGVEYFRSTGQAWNILSELSIFLTPLAFVIWAFTTIIWSENQTISTYRSMRLFEIYFLYIYIIARFIPYCWEYFSKCSTPKNSKMFHVEHFQSTGQAWNNLDKKSSKNVPPRKTHNCSTWNNSSVNQSVNVPPTYAKAPAGRRGTIPKSFIGLIIFIALIQSIIGIWQFIIKHSIGLSFLRESQISPILPGVAKIILNSQVFIRAYGLMPHPNILGGFLVFSIVLTLLWKKMFHACPVKPNCSTWNILNKINILKWDILDRLTVVLIVQAIALFLTFSKSAIIGLLVTLIYIYAPILLRYKKLFHLLRRQAGVEQLKNFLIYSAGIILIIASLFVFIKPNISSLITKSLGERLFYLNVSRGTILDNSLIGVGNGQFVLNIEKYAQSYLEIWQYQPVHNVFLLIWSELGVIGLVLFILWIWKLFNVEQFQFDTEYQNVLRGTFSGCGVSMEQFENNEAGEQSILCNNNDELSMFQIQRYFKGILLAFLFIMLFDHYLWDIWQGQVMFWMMAGFVAGVSRKVLK